MNQTDESTRKLLKGITRFCEPCPTMGAPPKQFNVSLPPSDEVFTYDIAMDLTLIYKKTALHVVDLETNFSSAT